MTEWAGRFAHTIRTIAGVLLVIVASAMVAVILGRYVGFATAWADEVARVAFVWSVCLGAASGTQRGLNFAIPLIATNRQGITRQILESAIALIMMSLCAALVWATTQSLPVANLSRMPALGFSRAWFHAAITVFGLLTGIFTLIRLAALWREPA